MTARTARTRGLVIIALATGLAGCDGSGRATREPSHATTTPRLAGPARTSTQPLAVNVLADTGLGRSLAAPPPTLDVNVSLARVAPVRAGLPDPPLPEAEPETALPAPVAEATSDRDASPRLEPPILLHPGTLVAPRRLRRAAIVELEVRVDALGAVTDVRWAAGDADTALVNAARRCAAAMQFRPARLAGRAVGVWCRQRFEFAPR